MYAISFRMLLSDMVAKQMVDPQDLLLDSRVQHYWDEHKIVGRWFDLHVTHLGEPGQERVEWDAYFLYGPDAVWEDEPPELVSWGRTIVASRAQLKTDLDALLAALEEKTAP